MTSGGHHHPWALQNEVGTTNFIPMTAYRRSDTFCQVTLCFGAVVGPLPGTVNVLTNHVQRVFTTAVRRTSSSSKLGAMGKFWW